MATPATGPIKQRYTAGSCALEIVAWPSALSQWSEHLIAERLTFRLWLADGASTTAEQIRATKRIVAKGDRTALQAITQYIQAETRKTLSASTLSASLSGAPPSTPFDETPSETSSGAEAASACPSEFHYPGSLGYIQLCDLNTVLSQCEQAVLTLPITSDQALSADVVLLDAVRDRRSLQSTNVLRLPRRPRKRIGLWASSAAAALFAVGLTTALLSRDPTPQDATVADNSAASSSVSELETAQQANSALESNTLDNSTSSADGTRPVEPPPDLSAPTPSPSASSDQSARPLPKIPNRPTRNPVVQPSASASAPLSAQELPDLPAPTVSSTPTPTRSRSSTSAIAPPPAIPESSGDSLFADQFEPVPDSAAAENSATSSARSAAPPPSTASQPAELAQGSTQTINQVQNYFQQRWQGGSEAVLVYELKLSADGEVAGFAAINEAAERERENVLPAASRPAFSVNPGTGNLTLRVLLNGNGTVQVIQPSQ